MELEMHRKVREIFAVSCSDAESQKELVKLRSEICRQQDHIDFITKDYEIQISTLQAELKKMTEFIGSEVASQNKSLLTELALREKIQQNLSESNDNQQSVNVAMKAILHTPYLLDKF
jgi:uncharacterized protein YbgA (DUF1722 family)